MRSRQEHVRTADGVRLFLHVVGVGPHPVVLPNGLHMLEDFAPLARAGRTLVFYDPRNRGRSDTVTDPSRIAAGIHNDVDDLEAVRRHLGAETISLIGHSYMGLVVILYAMRYGAGADRIVQIGAMGPHPDKQYPEHLKNVDSVTADVFSRLARLQDGSPSMPDPVERCRAFWAILRELYVQDPALAVRIKWDRCDLPNERNFMAYWTGSILPSIRGLSLTPAAVGASTVPVLTIHGRQDRSAPYGGAEDWVRLLRNARLLAIDPCGHAPWIEAPDRVLPAVDAFLDGVWPAGARPPDAQGG